MQCLYEEEAQCSALLLDGSGSELAAFEQVDLVGPDVFRPKLVGTFPEVRREILNGMDIRSYGILSVITTLELISIIFRRWVTRTSL